MPMSYVQGEERCRIEVGPGGGVLKVISVRININIKGETVEQLTGKKRSMHITAFKCLIDETRQWMRAYSAEGGRAEMRAATDKEYGQYGMYDIAWFISESIQQMQAIKDADATLQDEEYVNDLTYKALVTRMLLSQECAKQKLCLWLEHQETNIGDIGWTPLKSAHRQWLSFLKQRQHAVADAGSDKRKISAVRILQCKGLMFSNSASTEVADDEPLIYMAAADGWEPQDLKFLIDAGANVGAVNGTKASALHAASGNGDLSAIQVLVQAGANVNQLDQYGKSPIHYAARNGHPQTVECLVNYGADIRVVSNSTSGDGQSPIHAAAYGGHPSIVEYFVNLNADVNITDRIGQAPIHWAAENGHISSVQCLIKLGADVKISNMAGQTPIHGAARIGHVSTVACLAEHGADVNVVDQDGQAAIKFAAENGHPSVVECLVNLSADMNILDKRLRSPFHWAAENGHISTVQCLIKLGADVTAVDNRGYSAVDLASGIAQGRAWPECVAFLEAAGVKRGKSGR